MNNQVGRHLTDQQWLDWLRLIRSEHVGPRTFRTLLNHFGGAAAALAALPDLARRGGARGATKVCTRADAERELAAAERLGVTYLALGEPDYPVRLQAIDDPPPLIAVRGNRAALALPRSESSARAMRLRPVRSSRKCSHVTWPTPASRWSLAWRAGSTLSPIGPP